MFLKIIIGAHTMSSPVLGQICSTDSLSRIKTKARQDGLSQGARRESRLGGRGKGEAGERDLVKGDQEGQCVFELLGKELK